MEIHPLAALTEFGAGIDLDALAKHMKTFGYDPREACVIYESKLFDGRHRRDGAIRANLTPTFCRYTGNPLAYIAKKALRQHLGTGARAMLAAELINLYPEENSPPEGPGLQICSPQESGQEESSNGTPPSTAAASGSMNVSERSVFMAKKVADHGTDSLREVVKNEEVSVSDAAKVCKELPKHQDAAVKAVRAGEYKTLAAAVKEIKANEGREPGDDTQSEQEDEEQPKDEVGHLLTPACETAFVNLSRFKEIDRLTRDLQKLIDEVSKADGGEQLARCLQPTGAEGKTINKSEHLNNLIRDVKSTRPYSVCPYCKGKPGNGCKGCNRTGWVTKTTWNGAEESLKAEVI
jgi:hypothetical protein